MVLHGEHSFGIDLIAVGYKYNKKTVLNFVCTTGAGCTADGIPYEMKWTDECGNVNVRKVPRPEVISKFFQYSNSVDTHNHLRQSCLRLEKKWVTTDCWFRLMTTLIGITTVDTFRLARYHGLLPQGKLKLILDQEDYEGTNECSVRQFAGILSTQLLYLAQSQKRSKGDGARNRHDEMEESKGSDGTGMKERLNRNGSYECLNGVRGEGEECGENKYRKRKEVGRRDFFVGDVRKFRKIEPQDEISSSSGSSDNGDIGYGSLTNRQRLAMADDDDILQQMKDIGGGSHTECKLGVVVSKGKATKGKRYVNRRKCVWCGVKTSVHCIECGKVYCYPVLNRTKVVDSCFYHHVHYFKDHLMTRRSER